MLNLMNIFVLAFIPIFVAIDPLGMVPVFLSISQGLDRQMRQKLALQATLTAFIISMIFLFAGQLIFKVLGITVNDFRIGGGIVLLVLAITDLLFSQDEKSRTPEGRPALDPMFGVVPLGVPLVMGPAALTTILMTNDNHGYLMTLAALLLNLVIVWISFRESNRLIAIIGKGGAKAFAKVTSLFLVAIAVMMIRVGVTDFIKR